MTERAEWVSTDGRETIEDGQLWQAVAQGVARVVESTAVTVMVHWLDDARTTSYRYRLAGELAEGDPEVAEQLQQVDEWAAGEVDRPAGDYSRGAAADTMRDNAASRDLYERGNHLPPQGHR